MPTGASLLLKLARSVVGRRIAETAVGQLIDIVGTMVTTPRPTALGSENHPTGATHDLDARLAAQQTRVDALEAAGREQGEALSRLAAGLERSNEDVRLLGRRAWITLGAAIVALVVSLGCVALSLQR
jgi:hypothetical protein